MDIKKLDPKKQYVFEGGLKPPPSVIHAKTDPKLEYPPDIYIIAVTVLFILLHGEPDLLDVFIRFLMR
jgi:hypothetical protein